MKVYTLLEDTMKHSAAVIVTDGEKVLVIHPTDMPYWEIPKGLVDSGESVQQAAERELYEETGLHISASKMKIVSQFMLHIDKKITLLISKLDTLPPIQSYNCKSTFGPNKKPEVDKWEYITIDQIESVIRPVLNKQVLKAMQDINTKN